MTQGRRTPPLAVLLLGLLAVLHAGISAANTSDLRMLIDVSGSMRENDPNNLRVPALRLVSELLPGGNRAGVWLFADGPAELVPVGVVDDRWKEIARTRLRRIHSNGNFTDIEAAIDAALAGWSAPPGPDEERHLVLLTDGLVDVPDAPSAASPEASDAASRERIIESSIPRLQDLGVEVHVVALSDQVDADLVEALTAQTGGWLEIADSADKLQRAFLRMLEQSAPPTTVPIEGNRFTIDSGVREFTLLAFHARGKPVSLIDPDGNTISAGRIPLNGSTRISWNDAADYDLVTVTAPTAGEWALEGSLDPDNRVAVLTDLNLAMTPIANAIPSLAGFEIEIWPTDQGAPVTLEDFLQLATAKTIIESTAPPTGRDASPDAPPAAAAPGDAPGEPGSEAPALSLVLPLDPESLKYRIEVPAGTLEPGTYRLNAILESATFTRQLTRNLRLVGSPLEIRYEQRLPDPERPGEAALLVRLDIEADLLRTESLFGYLSVEGPENSVAVIEFDDLQAGTSDYEIPISAAGSYRASARLRAETAAGEAMVLEPPSETFVFEFDDGSTETPPAAPTEGISWPLLAAVVGGGTLGFAVLIGGVLWLTRSPSAKPAKKPKGKGQSKDKKTAEESAGDGAADE